MKADVDFRVTRGADGPFGLTAVFVALGLIVLFMLIAVVAFLVMVLAVVFALVFLTRRANLARARQTPLASTTQARRTLPGKPRARSLGDGSK